MSIFGAPKGRTQPPMDEPYPGYARSLATLRASRRSSAPRRGAQDTVDVPSGAPGARGAYEHHR